MGRFLSPDWSAQVEPVPYSKLDDPQTLNLYTYVRNNPLASIDPDGHSCARNGDASENAECTAEAPKTAAERTNELEDWIFGGGASLRPGESAQQQKYDPSKTGPEDPSNPGHSLYSNSAVKKGSDKAFMMTTNGQAGNGLAEAGFSIDYDPKTNKISLANWTTSVNADGTLNQLSIKTDANTIAILHTHGNKGVATPSLPDKSRGTPGDVASPFPNYVRSASHLYVTIPGTSSWTNLGTP